MVQTIKDPIFVKGISRSGGTLLVTLLDAHPDIAMQYEMYPENLFQNRKNSEPVSVRKRQIFLLS